MPSGRSAVTCLVILPTETVYGLAADAGNSAAVAALFEAKGRPRFNPLIAHVADPTPPGGSPPELERPGPGSWPRPSWPGSPHDRRPGHDRMRGRRPGPRRLGHGGRPCPGPSPGPGGAGVLWRAGRGAVGQPLRPPEPDHLRRRRERDRRGGSRGPGRRPLPHRPGIHRGRPSGRPAAPVAAWCGDPGRNRGPDRALGGKRGGCPPLARAAGPALCADERRCPAWEAISAESSARPSSASGRLTDPRRSISAQVAISPRPPPGCSPPCAPPTPLRPTASPSRRFRRPGWARRSTIGCGAPPVWWAERDSLCSAHEPRFQ